MPHKSDPKEDHPIRAWFEEMNEKLLGTGLAGQAAKAKIKREKELATALKESQK